jgi:type VI secretion system protein ImpL
LREMQRFFHVQFPIYVVVTHCDRLAGFEAFFQHLDRAAADQAWGVTFAGRARQPEDASLTEFPREFAALVQRLQGRMVPLVAAGGDVARAGKVYGFPAQFEALGEPLCTFLSGVFAGSPYAPTAWLRGVYFTSAAQDEEAVPRRASALATVVQQGGRTSGPRSLAGAHGYFIARLLRNVVFQEHGLAGGAPAFHRRGRLLRCLITAGVLAAFVGAAGALYAGYLRNQALIAAVDGDTARLASLAATAEKEAMPAEPAAILALLATARRPVPSSSQSAWSDVLLRRVGLYQGDMLANAARATYGALLRR